MLRETMTKKIKVETKIEPKEEQKADLKDVVIVEQKPEKKTKRKPAIGAIEIKDDDYAKEAETFASVNVVIVPSAVPSTDEKVVVLQDEKTRKDYQKEYQRKYRQQKKEKAAK
jgi:hypothetical protein